MDLSVNHRVREILKEYNLKPLAFAKRLGMPRATKIYNIVNDKTGVSAPMIDLIAKKFADINPEWIMTGIPPKFKNAKHTGDQGKPQSGLEADAQYVALEKKYNALRKELDKARKEMEEAVKELALTQKQLIKALLDNNKK
jgi:transcriptional regulator with XRE-family HTH domain